MTKVVYKEKLTSSLFRMDLEAPRVAAKAMPGQFIIVRPTKDGERIPLTVAGYDREKGLITIIFQVVGATTYQLSLIEEGQDVADFVGPLGQPSHFDGMKRVICIGGGVGTAVVYPQVKHLHEQGVQVDVINGARTKEMMILEKDLRENCDNLYLTTDDGSYVRKGFVTDVLRELLEKGEKYDMAVAIGPIPMMKAVCAVTKEFGLKTMVSLNPIMVDGTGMCGGCRVTVGGKTKYACVDGPDFDGHEVDFDEMATRSRFYKEEEACLSGLFGGGLK